MRPCKARLEAKAKDKEAKAKEKNAEDLAKMGEDEGTHTGPNPGSPPESDSSKVDQPESRNVPRTMQRNHEASIVHGAKR